MFTHITVADQEELQQVIVLFLLRTTVGVKRHANFGESRTRQVVIGSGGRFSRTGSRVLRSGRRAREGGQTDDSNNRIGHIHATRGVSLFGGPEIRTRLAETLNIAQDYTGNTPNNETVMLSVVKNSYLLLSALRTSSAASLQ